jgi:primosomal protein N' (replication factor Y)
MSRIASVLLPLPLPEAFDYAEPEGLDLAPGDQVAVPLGPRLVRGVVTAVRDGAGGNRPLKPVEGRLDDPPLPPGTLDFVAWAARYAVDAPGQALAIALRGARAPRARPERQVHPTGLAPARMTAAREKVMSAAAETAASPAELARRAGVSPGVVKALIDEGVLALRLATVEAAFPEPDLTRPRAALNPSQAAAAEALDRAGVEAAFTVALLDGVTGSGKTEVYLETAAAVLAADADAQVLILLPEIALTQAVIARVTTRFGARPAQWHSDVAPPERRRVW